MNERIQKLADNATHYANGVCDADPNADWYETRDQKFAELIVRECANICDADYARCGQDGAGWRLAREIGEHFGVEE
jgi:hypothetical protein